MTPILYTPLRVEQIALACVAPTLRLVRTGMGARRALPAPGQPGLVAGVCGALTPELRPGDVVVADAVRYLDGGRATGSTPVPSAPLLAATLRRLGLTVHVGPIVSAPRLTRLDTVGADGAIAVDMETATLAEHVGAPQVPFAAVRTVVDTPGHPLARPLTAVRGLVALRALRAASPALRAWAAATGPRQVRLASPRSFCAGVSRAVDTVELALQRFGPPVYVRRQIVHNAHVVSRLRDLGAVFVDEVEDIPPAAVTVLAAHGVAPAVRDAATERGLRVIDATCPLVSKVHAEIRRYARAGHTVFLIGHSEHEEVQGSLGEAPAQVMVVPDVAAARRVRPPDPDRVAYTMQTTLAVDDAEQIAGVLRERFPALAAPGSDDICYATTNRQRAVRTVAAQSQLVLVLGSANSSNTRRLVEVAQRCGATAHLVEDAGQVDLRWLAGVERIGLTAGASAPPHLVEELLAALGGLGALEVEDIHLTDEDIRFALPKEVL